MSENPDSPFVIPEEPSPPKRAPRQGFWLFHLFFRPRVFFSYFPAMVTPFSTAYAALILGVTEVSGRVTEEALKRNFGGSGTLPSSVLESWTAYWLACLVLGVVGACFYYVVGGWWFRVRLKWSGVADPDRRLARRLYIFAYLILALPMLVLTILDSFQYARPIDAERGSEGGWWIVSLICPFWSVYAGYRGVRTLFPVVRWKARIWFLVLPSLFFSVVMAGAILAIMLAAWGLVPMPPDVDWPSTLDRPGFSLQYPGNWWVDDTDDEYDPDSYFSIMPMQDAGVDINVLQEAIDPTEYTLSCVQSYREVFVGGEMESFTRWGSHRGYGLEYVGTFEGGSYRVRVFTTSTGARGLTVVEYAEMGVESEMAPGFALIRTTFRFKD